jgi:hypothetical protein
MGHRIIQRGNNVAIWIDLRDAGLSSDPRIKLFGNELLQQLGS